MGVFSGLIQEVDGNIVPRDASNLSAGSLIQTAGMTALAAFLPEQFEAFHITIQLIGGSSQGPDAHTDSFTFPVMPEALMEAQRYLMTVTPTLGGVYVDDFGRAPSPINMMGTFGRQPRTYLGSQGNIASVSGVVSAISNSGTATGYGMCKRLSSLVEASHTPSVDGKLPRVLFYNWAFNSHWEAVINGVDFRMDVQQNNLWFYQLQITTLRKLDSVSDSVNGLVSSVLGGLSGSLISDITAPVTTAVNKAAAFAKSVF